MTRKLEAMRHDNRTPLYRSGPFGQRVLPILYSWFFDKLDSELRDLPIELGRVEQKNAERIKNPKSIYVAEQYKVECLTLGQTGNTDNDLDLVTAENLRRDTFEDRLFNVAPVKFQLDPEVAKKSSGPPDFVSKERWFVENRTLMTNIKHTIQRNRVPLALDMVYASFSGIRTQQAKLWKPPNKIEAKVRVINMVPAPVFCVEYELVKGLIAEMTVNTNIGRHIPIFTYYCDFPDSLKNFISLAKKSQSIVVLDFSGFDHSIQQNEQLADYNVFVCESPAREFMMQYATYAPLIHPWGLLQRTRGRLSGLVSTNAFNCMDNVCDMLQALRRSGLLSYLVGVMVNGDDIILFFSTSVTVGTINRVSRFSAHILSADKCGYAPHSAYYGKRYWDAELGLQCSSIAKAINSMCFVERSSDIIKAGKEYTYLAVGEILLNVGVDHPWFESFRSIVRENQKYKSSDLDRARLKEAQLEYYGEKERAGQYQSSEPDKRLSDIETLLD
jgi:hypothetical protein